ncbi:fatty acid desaturase [Pseudooceanicola sp. 216_PA32_1]|uniref:Fatty acid desaturase n=1 Tax=Pseudooceanicola pacificus TaxID=2676438 RepID=A0A844W275_9RHOB|nr:fatty acid desaturase [Pseudooceanicola pacificus]MWB77195.1 fatty acid desaturase [Pseudooceanicola pacificus]
MSDGPAPPADHRIVLSAIPPEARARLSTRRNAPGVARLLAHGGAVGLLGWAIAARVPGWPLLMLPQGVLLAFLFTLEHECTHTTPFRSRRLNEVVGHVTGALGMLPFLWFRHFHLAHHRHTNLPGLDPELDSPKPDALRAWLWHVSGLPLWYGNLALVIRLARGRERPAYLPARARPRAEAEARGLLILYTLVALSLIWTPLPFWIWLLPSVLGQPLLRIYLLAEHGDCPRTANMLENTRTTFTTALVRLIAWNMPYHIEHHAMPAAPFHALPALHGHMRRALRTTAPGYAAFTRAYLARRRP